MHNGARYSRRLEARNETEALAALALFDRDPDAYLTKSQAAWMATDEAVLMEAELVARFLAYFKAEGRTERYRRNMRTYLAQWAEALAGRDLRHVTLQELQRELAKRPNTKKHRIIALKSFFSFLRELEAVITPAQDATLGLRSPCPPREDPAQQGLLDGRGGDVLQRHLRLGVPQARRHEDGCAGRERPPGAAR